MNHTALGPKGPKINVWIRKTLGFNKIEICPWDAAVYIDCETVEYSIFSYSQTSLLMAIALRPKGPETDVRKVQI